MKRNLIYYIALLFFVGAFLLFFIHHGQKLENIRSGNGGNAVSEVIHKGLSTGIHKTFDFLNNLKTPFSKLLLQIILIIVTARMFGFVLRKLGQPTVMGEILAGIILGPSVMGLFFPGFFGFMFPKESVDIIGFLSEIGLILFMFIIGMELDLGIMKRRMNSAVIIGSASIVFPFICGILLAFFLYDKYAPHESTFIAFALFMGIALSITALPVLSRIIIERGMTKSYVGIVSLVSAAFNDIAGWCLLATVVAIVQAGSFIHGVIIIGFSLFYLLIMVFVIRPVLKRAGDIYISNENLNKSVMAVIFLLLFISSFITDVIGIHTLFGAFMAGVIMPNKPGFKKIIIEKIEDISVIFLLPLFFVYTGLRTDIALISNWHMVSVACLIIVVAVAAKLGGGVIASRLTGMSWKDSFLIGTLLNTRGLITLIVLNVGYEMGILSGEIFTIMVVMALVTTFMTGPLLKLIDYLNRRISGKSLAFGHAKQHFRILLSFAKPSMGSKLLQIAALFHSDKNSDHITALHITPNSHITLRNSSSFENEVFRAARAKAAELSLQMETKYKVTENFTKYIISTFRKGKFNFLLLGAAQSLFTESRIGGRIKTLMDAAENPVGIFIDHELSQVNKIFTIISCADDLFLMQYVRKMLKKDDLMIIVFYTVQLMEEDVAGKFPEIFNNSKNPVILKGYDSYMEIPYPDADLTVLSLNAWKKLNQEVEGDAEVTISSSILIIKK